PLLFQPRKRSGKLQLQTVQFPGIRSQDLRKMREVLGRTEPDDGDRYELQRLLHGFAAVVKLHFAQEEEIYRSLESR
ncbi:hypothetical protein, partial [Thioclava sp. IC9]|uniref:hypothetical protein n=1 Tax=Thioclava sp. IC9 TaxID=1973007 RepID=UPI00197D6306